MKQAYQTKVLRQNANNPLFDILKRLTEKKQIDEKYQEQYENKYTKLKRKRDLSYAAKEELFRMSENAKRQPYKTWRCKDCERELRGPQELFILHMQKHFTQENEGIEKEAHVYKY